MANVLNDPRARHVTTSRDLGNTPESELSEELMILLVDSSKIKSRGRPSARGVVAEGVQYLLSNGVIKRL